MAESQGEIVVCLGLAAYFRIRSRGIVFFFNLFLAGRRESWNSFKDCLDERGRKESRIKLDKNKLIWD